MCGRYLRLLRHSPTPVFRSLAPAVMVRIHPGQLSLAGSSHLAEFEAHTLKHNTEVQPYPPGKRRGA